MKAIWTRAGDASCEAIDMKWLRSPYLRFGLLGLIMAVVNGCAAVNPASATLQPVGPGSVTIKDKSPATGYLMVYTAIVEPNIVPDTMFAPHMGYTIRDRRGNFVRDVRNHIGAWDETPDLVNLPPGHYTVLAKTETGNNLVVPVIIKAQKTTSVNLEWREPGVAKN
jgi:hypothetical protein